MASKKMSILKIQVLRVYPPSGAYGGGICPKQLSGAQLDKRGCPLFGARSADYPRRSPGFVVILPFANVAPAAICTDMALLIETSRAYA